MSMSAQEIEIAHQTMLAAKMLIDMGYEVIAIRPGNGGGVQITTPAGIHPLFTSLTSYHDRESGYTHTRTKFHGVDIGWCEQTATPDEAAA